MSAVRNIRMLARYNKWANNMLLDAIAALPLDEVIKNRAAAFGGMSFALAHVAIVDQIWQAHLLGKDHGFKSRTTESPDSLAALTEKLNESGDWYIQYADSMTEPLLNEKLSFLFVDGGAGEMTRGDILIHVFNHKTFHRGHIGDMFYQSGFRPPSIDLPVYLRDAFNESELG
ncbi:MAG: damage-inducible protein DinB [Polynucleobacter sp. 35-46-11]|uniref:DinB family protein n=1 Tax=Polynucleobacter sp. 35-46-11 TaxID=1970425 RepID=UPI000BC71F26|nr:DinB family protein [Polynucleobacter sp. 35-46-11]OYY07515.1 MAG: damage-inducible protein DinB [Polynucleobacter sp. 35-46-11]